jgi:DNA-binding winged helix-turn-helix (wHTH) protein
MPAQRLLLDADARVRLGNRAFQILTALVERPGELLTKRELIARAWPDVVVEENNLKVQINALRKALGEGPQDQRYLATVTGRGYQFVARVETEFPTDASPATPPASVAHNIPAALARLIGRAETVDSLRAQLSRSRLITVSGPGGMGKTTVALAVARAMVEAAEHDIWFVDLSMLSEPGFLFHAIATAVGLTVHSSDIQSALANYFHFRNRSQLIVLDSCEHVIDAAATAAERLLTMSPHLQSSPRAGSRSAPLVSACIG